MSKDSWKKLSTGSLYYQKENLRATILFHCGGFSVEACIVLDNNYADMIHSPYYIYDIYGDVFIGKNEILCENEEEAIKLAKEWVENYGNYGN